jgi:GT2 family glycosyltransferase/glycosyltransferase involved in cell wall biosynthesis
MAFNEEISARLQELINSDSYLPAVEYLTGLANNADVTHEQKAEYFYYIGKLFYQKEDFANARENFIKSLRLNSEGYYAKFYLARIYEYLNDPETAFTLYSQCLSGPEESIHVFDYLKETAPKIECRLPEEIKFLCGGVSKAKREDAREEFPKISIILLCYNKFEYTKKCIASIFKNTAYPNYEIVAVDNASIDQTSEYLETYGKKIKYVRINSNVGFIGGNNIGVSQSDAKYVVFLNNDTEVMPDWLDNLYNTFVYHPDAGGAGSKLIFADNTLQEAGAAVFNDATGWNYGRNGEVFDARYNFVREVDYCSGAALMVRCDVFNKLGGYDYLFAPAYFEDTDLCFNIRKLGYKIYYCYSSHVIHYEGITNGTDVNTGLKRYQILNAPKFINKWRNELKLQYPNDPQLRYQFSNRKQGKRVLIIDDIPPLPDRASGALRHYNTLKQLLDLNCQVTYAHMMGKQFRDKNALEYFYQLKMAGVEFHWFNYEGWWGIRNEQAVKPILQNLIDSLELKLRKFDFVYIAFWHIAEYFIDLIRRQIPDTPVIIDSVDIHYLRELRRAETLKNQALKKEALETKKKELALYSKADCVLTVTENDAAELRKDLRGKAVFVVPDVHDAAATNTSFNEREGFLFVGNFNHNPNEDAVFFFVNEMFPLIKEQIPGVKFYVVGNNPTERIKNLACEDIIVTGWVPDVVPYLEKCRVTVVPLRFGAGMKGKVGQSLSRGLPMVSTSIGAEGMGIEEGIHAFIADTPEEFAARCVELYNNREKWNDFSERGKTLIDSQFSSAMMRKRLSYVTNYETREAYKTEFAINSPNPPRVSIILVTYNQFEYTKKCLESIKKHTGFIYEIILVDNASADDTVKQVKTHYPEIRVIENETNLGFPAAVNQGITASLGDYALILNNDTIVTAGWLEGLLEAAEEDESVGLTGPVSNSVSGVQIDREAAYSTIEEMHKYAAAVRGKNRNERFAFPRIAFLCALIKRKVVNAIGGLDERFSPGNFEDDDFCLRAQLAGFKTVINKGVFIHHFGSKSFKAGGEQEYAERLRVNGEKFAEKWGGSPEEIWLKGKEIKDRNVRFPINNDGFAAAFDRALIAVDENEPALAALYLDAAIKTFHSSKRSGYAVEFTDVLNLCGNINLIIGNSEKAKECFEEELKITPASSRACAGLGDVFAGAGISDMAKTMYEWGVKNDPSNNAASAGLAKVNKALGLPENHNTLMDS